MWDAENDDDAAFERRMASVVREVGERGKLIVAESVPPVRTGEGAPAPAPALESGPAPEPAPEPTPTRPPAPAPAMSSTTGPATAPSPELELASSTTFWLFFGSVLAVWALVVSVFGVAYLPGLT